MARKTLDQRVDPLKSVNTVAPNGGWIRAVRQALGMSATQFAKRADVTRQTAQQYERSEIDGSIRLDTIRRAAEVLDCRFLYALVPKTSFDEIVREQASKVATNELARVDQTMLLENQRVDRREMEQRLAQRIEELIGSGQLWNAASSRER